MAPEPQTPTKKEGKQPDLFDTKLEMLSVEWDLGLQPKKDYSPEKRGRSLSDKCIEMIRFLHYKKAFDPALIRFRQEATILYSGWVHKPKAERGVVPEATRNKPRPVTPKERVQLLRLLQKILEEDKAKYLSENSPSSARFSGSQKLDDSPAPFSLAPKSNSDPKRPRDEEQELFSNVPVTFKKPRKPDPQPSTTSKTAQETATSSKVHSFATGSMLPPETRTSANTSFASDISSVFSRRPSYNNSWQPGTQETVPDIPETEEEQLIPHTQAVKDSFINPQPDKAPSSTDYGTSSFEERIAGMDDAALLGTHPASPEARLDSQTDVGEGEGLSQDLLGMVFGDESLIDSEKEFQDSLVDSEKAFQDSLHQVFCELPVSLQSASLRVIYEITRVCLHTGVSFDEIDFPEPAVLDDYNILWRFLKGVRALEGKSFPERCPEKLWDLASGNFSDGFQGVAFSGSLRFNSDQSHKPLFQFRLQPMKSDLSHRVGRRFGHDRFFEIDIPELTHRNIPKSLKKMGVRGYDIICDWLVCARHPLLGRHWQPFSVKPLAPPKRKPISDSTDADEVAFSNRLYFFALDGVGIGLPKIESPPIMTIEELLNSIRPIESNAGQPFLKLFARNALVVSRNSATITLEPQQIFHLPDIYNGKDIMTDGAGRLSESLADLIKDKLGLAKTPSGFQARIGEAKGFWSVAYGSKRPGVWIELYASQCKWTPEGNDTHPCNRTLEILRWSSPLKSADLNLQFLPLLIQQSSSPSKMKQALAGILKEGLETELLAMQTAMDDPMLFRQWLYESNPNISERAKLGTVPYNFGLPVAMDERLNMLLRAGFEPKRLHFMKDLALKAFENKCKDLQARLNITVGRSTYAYMVPDFSGVLEPDEVYIHFSGFVDKVSGFDGTILDGVDVLVARSPAHFASDIQRVKAVFKIELKDMKDVIVFSTKGNPSLAQKLSGGDYDGDIAWICWEPTLVENFENADVPECPDLVKEGLIKQDLTTYEQLVVGYSDPTTVFLRKSFAFNLKQRMLGICTNHKEKVCYTQSLKDKYNTREAIWLSTLLSCLVDQAKQGYSFTEEDWTNFKNTVIGFNVVPLQYKNTDGYFDANAKHIIDHLMYTASRAIKKSITAFHARLPTPPHWDPDLVVYYEWAKVKAESKPEWKVLLDTLYAEVDALKKEWEQRPRKPKSFRGDDSKSSDYLEQIAKFYPRFQAILPHGDSSLVDSLLTDCFDVELSPWAQLRASVLFHTYHQFKNPGVFVWFMAAKQLTVSKAYQQGGFPPAVTPSMSAMEKPDAAYVRRVKANEAAWEDQNMSVTNAEEIEERMDD